MAAPPLISYTEVSWTTTGTSPKTTASISWNIGDVLVVIGGSEGPATLGVPTTSGSGLAFVSQKSNSAAGSCATQLAACVATATSSGTISMTTTNAGIQFGFGVWVWRGSAGIGNSAEQHTATLNVNMTPIAAHCGTVLGTFDFGAAAVQTIIPTPTNTRQRVDEGTTYTVYVSDVADQASAGATAYGISGTGTGPFSIVAMEIQASSGAPGWNSPTAGPSFAI